MKVFVVALAIVAAMIFTPGKANASQDTYIYETTCNNQGICTETVEVPGKQKLPKRIFKVDRYGRINKRWKVLDFKQITKQSKFKVR